MPKLAEKIEHRTPGQRGKKEILPIVWYAQAYDKSVIGQIVGC